MTRVPDSSIAAGPSLASVPRPACADPDGGFSAWLGKGQGLEGVDPRDDRDDPPAKQDDPTSASAAVASALAWLPVPQAEPPPAAKLRPDTGDGKNQDVVPVAATIAAPVAASTAANAVGSAPGPEGAATSASTGASALAPTWATGPAEAQRSDLAPEPTAGCGRPEPPGRTAAEGRSDPVSPTVGPLAAACAARAPDAPTDPAAAQLAIPATAVLVPESRLAPVPALAAEGQPTKPHVTSMPAPAADVAPQQAEPQGRGHQRRGAQPSAAPAMTAGATQEIAPPGSVQAVAPVAEARMHAASTGTPGVPAPPAPAEADAQVAPDVSPAALRRLGAALERAAVGGGPTHLEIDLEPAALGRVHLDIVVEGGELRVRGWTAEADAARALAQQLPDLRAALLGQQVRLADFSVVWSGAAEPSESPSRRRDRPAATAGGAFGIFRGARRRGRVDVIA